jgi:dihydroxyacid dehydratase/phosphogluconate dehydratase
MSSSNDGIRLRSAQWYAGDDRNAYIHRAWMRRGVPGDAFTGRPHIAIANTASDLTPCDAHLTEVAASVKNGVYEAGGIPLELPVVSLGETLLRPTAMLWRNTAAMATEEMLRANPIDGVVLLGGCDKTIPALLMAAASVDLTAVVVPGGPMLTGTFRGVSLGCGTDVWRLSEEVRAGTLSWAPRPRWRSSRRRSARSSRASPGHQRRTVACWRPRTGLVGWSWRWSPPTDGRARSSRRHRSPTRS